MKTLPRSDSRFRPDILELEKYNCALSIRARARVCNFSAVYQHADMRTWRC